ncbi:predicted protein, partial [Nematostella vectensis]
CLSQSTCNECISKPSCAWCSQEVTPSRCDTYLRLKGYGCREENISNPQSIFSETKNDPVGATIQVTPQRVTLKLRPGIPSILPVTIRPAENYPVDLYYLMDMSWSMENDLDNLKKLAGKIAESMKNITKNFKLGFGSFVDKTVSPYVRTELTKPCSDTSECVASYGFKHILPLVRNDTMFKEKVNEQKISGNLDEPEGGFDALMQVAVCDQQIGWSVNGTSRRLVVFVTDAPFHLAGDGKLGGIVTPNDGQCHLSNSGVYTKSDELDYPSIAQLHEKLLQKQIQPIFAVTGNVTDLYLGLSNSWDDLGATTGVLAEDSGNVVQLIKNSYEKIASTVKLSYKAPPGISVSYSGTCKDGQPVVNGECTGVGIGQKVKFDVSVTLDRCTEDVQKYKSFPIRVPGFGLLNVDLEFICSCQCDGKDFREENSTRCSSGNGTYACGQCQCHKGRYGELCECDNPFDKKTDVTKCKATNATDEPPCSGQGQCICGKCVCNRDPRGRIYGDKCQCNDFSCQEHQGLVCGGNERGVCDCGVCKCKDVYVGVNCGQRNCSLLDFECRKDKGSPVCGGPDRGTCECGKCKCNRKYTGQYCEECPSCEGGICSRSKDCILCTKFEKKSLDDCKKLNRCEPIVQSVEFVDKIETLTAKGLYRCEGARDKCTYYFTYDKRADGKTYDLYVQEKQDCPEPAPILAIVLGVVGGILLIGLLLLLIGKIMVSMVDRIEYKKFERDRMRSKWHREKNPLYKEAKTTFENPTYAGR